jgi:hypothetical protein
LQIEMLGRLVADLQCSLLPLDLNTQCGRLAVTVGFTVTISVSIAVSISGKRKVSPHAHSPAPPGPPKPPKPGKTPTGGIVGVILFVVLLALCYYGVTGPQAAQEFSNAVGQSSSAPSPSLSLHVQPPSHESPRPRVRRRHGHRLRDSRHGS